MYIMEKRPLSPWKLFTIQVTIPSQLCFQIQADMDFLSSFLTSAAAAIFILLFSFSIFVLRIYTGKSLKSSLYPPVMGTVFHQLLFFNRLYDELTSYLHQHRTFRLLAVSHSEVYTADPRNIEHVLKTRFNHYSKGEYNCIILRDLFGEGIFAVDGDKWRQQRKLASLEFSTRVLRDFSCSVFRLYASKLAGIISEYATKGLSVNIQDLLMKCTLDSIFKVGFGVDFNCLSGSSKDASSFMSAFDESNALVYWRYADFAWKIKRFLNLGSEATLRKNVKVIDDFVYGVICSKREQLSCEDHYSDKEDILSRLLVESKKDPKNITDRYLRDIILNFIIAGKDSTANTLSWFFYMLCKHPLIQEKISQQVQEVIGDDGCKSIDNFIEKLTEEALDKMHYLHAALSETLRLYPAVPVDGKCADEDDILPDGYKVKKGDGVSYVSYAMGRMTDIWGEDAEEFKPERWLENGIFRPESPFKFIAFHAGPRICLGKDFAYRQMKIISMVLLCFFRFQLEDQKMQARYRTMFTLHIDGGLNLRVFLRLISSN